MRWIIEVDFVGTKKNLEMILREQGWKSDFKIIGKVDDKEFDEKFKKVMHKACLDMIGSDNDHIKIVKG